MKKINVQKLLLLFIILLPVLDIVSFGFRKVFGTTWSPSTFVRPLIPTTVFFIIFFKKNYKIKSICIICTYALYSIVHLIFFQKYLTGLSFGTINYELQYLINYTFNILVLFVFLFVFYKNDITSLKKAIIISCSIYIFSIYLSIITNTYTSTYVEGIGIKGWFESGNSLSTVLILGLSILLSIFATSNNKKYLIIVIFLFEFFLLLLLGTRTAMLGGLVFALLYIIFTIFFTLKNKKMLTKKNIWIFLLIFLGLIIMFSVIGSKTIERRKYLSSLNSTINVHTGEVLHVTKDIADIYNGLNNNQFSDEYMSNQEKEALQFLYDFANKYELSCTNRRLQQLIYNVYLVKYQRNFFSILFGNGLLNNYAELVLEIEIAAFILNFGFFGFILYFFPFLFAFIYALYNGFKYRKKIDIEFLMLLNGLFFSLISSCFTGVTFFNTSSATFVILIIVLLLDKIREYKTYDL